MINNELQSKQNTNLFIKLNNYIDNLTKNDFTKKYNCTDKITARLIKNILNICIPQNLEKDPSLKKYKFKAQGSQLFMEVKNDNNPNDENLIDSKLLENVRSTAIRSMSSLAKNWNKSDEATIDEILQEQKRKGYKFVPINLEVVENSDPVLLKLKGSFFNQLKRNYLSKDKQVLLKFYYSSTTRKIFGNRDCVQALMDGISHDMLPLNAKSLFKICLEHVAKNLNQYEGNLNQLPVELIEKVRNKKSITL